MELTKEEIKLIIDTFEEFATELSNNNHGTLWSEQLDLLDKLYKDINSAE